MPGLSDQQDAYGHAIYDCLHGLHGYEVDERDDGYVGDSMDAGVYLAKLPAWPAHEREALDLARGRALDLGCGGGRVGLELQRRGHEVVGIDLSPLAIQACREQGLRDARVMPVTQVGPQLGLFDTIVMFGNNFGLLGGVARGRWLLRRLRRLTRPGARILAASSDPSATGDPVHLAYHQRNLARGRPGGLVRIRVRYKAYRTPWFDYLLASRQEMADIVSGTGWCVACFVGDGPGYVGIIERTDA